ncbi:MAG: MazG nucleotide pyrophosphohydrolase domain-containing protein [Candidatus Uhrbacteria bacterium]
MDLSEIQRLVDANAERYSKKHGIPLSVDLLVLKLMEETGEFAEALTVSRNLCRAEKRVDPETAQANLAAEIADVAVTVLHLASMLKIDLEVALEKKALAKGRAYLAERNAA